VARQRGMQTPPGHQSSFQRLLGCRPGELLTGACKDIGDRSLHRGDGHAGAFGPLAVAQRCGVDHDAPSLAAEGPRCRDVDHGRHRIGQVVHGEGGVVTGDRVVAGPETGDDHILEALRGEPVEPVDALRDALERAGPCEVGQLLAGHPDLGSLRRRDVARATFREGVEDVDAGGHGCQTIFDIDDVNRRRSASVKPGVASEFGHGLDTSEPKPGVTGRHRLGRGSAFPLLRRGFRTPGGMGRYPRQGDLNPARLPVPPRSRGSGTYR
jgi:hypothetical protein